jgi:hypothetical protein
MLLATTFSVQTGDMGDRRAETWVTLFLLISLTSNVQLFNAERPKENLVHPVFFSGSKSYV